ncbi:tetratricopeptide repeat protein [Taibaiella koreensis]|uniref:tetratricopeptide repeat protein n=1 Tax=Taibaiella koreensis TaxID=1268548 RepID=UPI000E59F34F|nr:tetratricopeptide repeat protein [Taibaiella koreensis]
MLSWQELDSGKDKKRSLPLGQGRGFFSAIFAAIMHRTFRPVVLSLVLILLPVAGAFAGGKYVYDFNDRCQQAYQALVSLRIAEGNALLKEELKEHPDNLIPVFLANYDDCLTLLFNGDAGEYSRRKGNLDKRLELLEQGDEQSPWYQYCIGALHFQWAAVRIRYNEYWSAGMAFRKSFIELKDNRKQFPSFRNNQVLLGLEEAIVGTIPDSYKWISSMLGMKGDVRKGTAQIVDFLNHRDGSAALMREEAIFFFCYLKFSLLSDHKSVWKYLDESTLDFRNNHLYVFMKANFALNDNKAQLAEQVLKGRNPGSEYLEAPIFNYQLGTALLQKMDDDCIGYFQKFLNRYTGKLFVKDAYQKMSFYYLALGDLPQAMGYKNKIQKAGNAQVDADKQAQRYAGNLQLPNPFLLKARLLSDGGYYSRALDELKGSKVSDFPNTADQLEYNYRYARIYTLMEQPAKAIPFYEATIRMGANRQEHFAARSALEMGQIYEQQGLNDKAIACYRQCIGMKNHDYKSSLDQKAKAGIDRLGGNK